MTDQNKLHRKDKEMEEIRVLVENRKDVSDPTEIIFRFAYIKGNYVDTIFSISGFSHNYKEEIHNLLQECEKALDKPFLEQKTETILCEIK